MHSFCALTARLRGVLLETAGRLMRDPILVFRGQQENVAARLALRVADDSYLGPRSRPPMRCSSLTRGAHLRLIAAQ